MSPTADEFEPIVREICAAEGLQYVGLVGSGAFKHTYQVRRGEEAIALKIFKSTPTERSAREIEAMQRFNHPNIARLYSIHEHRGTTDQRYLCLLEEFLAGGTLTQRIRDHRMPFDELRIVARHLVDALSHIAALRLVHRDIKPDNVMFRDSGLSAVLVDFGLVRNLDAVSETASWLMRGPGTPLFAAPEQLNNDKALIDWRTDQFGLGVTLSFAAFGIHPYGRTGDTNEAIVQRVVDREGPSIEFQTLCSKAGLPMLSTMTQPWPVLHPGN